MTLPGLGDMLRRVAALLVRRWRWALLLAVLAMAYLAWCRWGAVATPPAGKPVAAPLAPAIASMPTKTVVVPLRVIADKPAAARRLRLGAQGPALHEEIQTAADLPRLRWGGTSTVLVNYSSGQSRTVVVPHSAPWFSPERGNEISLGVSAGTKRGPQADLEYRRDLFSIKGAVVMVTAGASTPIDQSTSPEARVGARVKYQW